MKAAVMSLKNEKKSEVSLPAQFSAGVREDLIRRAVLAIQTHKRQPYGSDPEAGMKASAELSRRRRKYRGSYGIGISRVPRKILTRQGTRMNWVGALAPGTVGGRRAHAPKVEKVWDHKINDKERRAAIISAISASVDSEYVKSRGHIIPESYPFIVENAFEELSKTKDVNSALSILGLADELKRTSERTIRAGKGKLRGRKYKTKVGPLLVVSKDCKLSKAAKNIPGVEVVIVDRLNAELLAPGTDPGRLTLYTESAVERMAKEKLFTGAKDGKQ